MFQPSDHFRWPFSGPTPTGPCPCAGGSRDGCRTPSRVSPQRRGRESPPSTCWQRFSWCRPGYSWLSGRSQLSAAHSARGLHTDHHPGYTLLPTMAEKISFLCRFHQNFPLFSSSNSKKNHALWAVHAVLKLFLYHKKIEKTILEAPNVLLITLLGALNHTHRPELPLLFNSGFKHYIENYFLLRNQI